MEWTKQMNLPEDRISGEYREPEKSWSLTPSVEYVIETK